MKLKYYLRGAGIGVIVTTLILTIALAFEGPTMSEEDIIREAEKLVKCILEHKNNKKNVEEESSQEKSMIDFFENKMKNILGSKVVIKNKKKVIFH